MANDRVQECVLSIHALPGAKKNEVLTAIPGQPVRIKISAPPVEGKANQALVDFLHDVLQLRKSQIEIVGGLNSREKRVKLAGLTEAEVFRILHEQIK
jgi:uncharacterized protein